MNCQPLPLSHLIEYFSAKLAAKQAAADIWQTTDSTSAGPIDLTHASFLFVLESSLTVMSLLGPCKSLSNVPKQKKLIMVEEVSVK